MEFTSQSTSFDTIGQITDNCMTQWTAPQRNQSNPTAVTPDAASNNLRQLSTGQLNNNNNRCSTPDVDPDPWDIGTAATNNDTDMDSD